MSDRPKRVLHVVRAMNRGGVETWLMHLLRRLDPRRVRMDFLVQTAEKAAFDAEIEDRGARLLRCPEPIWSLAYFAHFRRILGESGPFDAVHSHVHHFSGWLLGIARQAGVPIRIAHSHHDSFASDRSATLSRRCYLAASKRAIRNCATRLLAVSRVAGRALFGDQWERDPRSLVVHCGIDLSPFHECRRRDETRRLWGVSTDDLLVGHVGRFDKGKNHAYLLKIFTEVLHLRSHSRLLLVGDGPLRAEIEERAVRLGLTNYTIFAGVRDDVPRLLSAMDAFIFPSLWEGLPLTVLEAQAAGTPCIISDRISEETDVIRRLIHRVPLTRTPGEWAEIVVNQHRQIVSRSESVAELEGTSFDITCGADQMYGLYAA